MGRMDKHLLLGDKGCGNAIVEAAFALAGVPLDLERVEYSMGSPTRARLLEVNPLGQVPALLLPGGGVMTESLAMVHHLNDIAPKAGLIPKAGTPERARFLRWSTFLVAAIYPTFTYGDEPAKWTPAGAGELRQSTEDHRKSLWRLVEGAVRGPWFLGERPSALDLYVSVMTRWRPRREWFAEACPRLHKIALAVDEDARLAGVWATNFA